MLVTTSSISSLELGGNYNNQNIRHHNNNENSFARAFGGDGGTCECRGGCPPDPPSVGDVTGSFPLSLFSSRKDFWRMSGIILELRDLCLCGVARGHVRVEQTRESSVVVRSFIASI